MSGIIVGMDGSAHSRKALEYAAKEAVAHHTSLTVLTVHQAVRDVYGGVSNYSDDASLTDKARQAA
ncbi:MAG TPA: universal stress protein, partial [Streptosporangiaceae bacterium]|nr:universal stress protein [Streptosporangiaceae bacterium]